MAGEEPITPATQRVRQIDASLRTLAVESLRAIIGILIAFSVSWWISGALHLRSGFGGYAGSAAIFVVMALVALTITSGLPIHDALAAQRSEIARQQGLLQAVADSHQFSSDLHTAMQMAEHEPDVLQLIGRALDLVSDGPGELLLADSSQAHLHQGAASVINGAAGCGVNTPWGCPAVRQGQILEFSDSQALATCPHLQVRREQVSALCVPVTVLGTSTGVIHLTRPAAEPLDMVQRARAEVLAIQTGARLGLLRALATSEIAATTDSLTGQLNRRSLEEALRRLDIERIPYAVAFADLDNFKVLNDTHGHAAGDRALRHFATVTGATVRTGDLVCRFGGEEFLLVYVGCEVTEAAPIVHRLRTALGESVIAAGVPPFTVSIGLADSTYATTAAEIIAYADAALMTAKREGRDRLIIAAKLDHGPLPLAEPTVP
jgi:diguanylate cyclase (GGDEF)-like protein